MVAQFGSGSHVNGGHDGSVVRGSPASRSQGAMPPAGAMADLSLSALVESEVIPRLLIAVARRSAPRRDEATGSISAEEVRTFAPLPLELEADELLHIVEGFLGRGVAIESILVDLLAPSARRLGQYWEDDGCDFLDVTIGLWRLTEVMHELTARYPPPGVPIPPRRAALFAAMPGDVHSFGAQMVEDMFARAGWHTRLLVNADRRELLHVVGQEQFDMAGLTVSCDCPTAALADMVASLRSASKGRFIKIFIGGRMVNANPDIVSAVGADGTAGDARSLLRMANETIRGHGASHHPAS